MKQERVLETYSGVDIRRIDLVMFEKKLSNHQTEGLNQALDKIQKVAAYQLPLDGGVH